VLSTRSYSYIDNDDSGDITPGDVVRWRDAGRCSAETQDIELTIAP
jgi:hypothetical protein